MRHLLYTLLLIGLTAWPQPLIAQDSEKGGLLQPVPPFGIIDWGAMQLQATGQGFAPSQAAGTPRGQRMAERAAVLDARRNLVEMFASVRVDSRTLVRDVMVQNDVAYNQLAGVLLQNTQEQRRDLEDGGVEVTVSASLRGSTARLLWQLYTPHVNTLENKEIQQKLQNLEVDKTHEPKSSAPQDQSNYSGLVVDARGLEFILSLRPDIHGPKSRLYPPASLVENQADQITQQGHVAYFPTVELALASGRVGSNPLVLSAASSQQGQRAALRLDAADAAALQRLLAQPQSPLLRGALAIVY